MPAKAQALPNFKELLAVLVLITLPNFAKSSTCKSEKTCSIANIEK
jgi:hypothetical protein